MSKRVTGAVIGYGGAFNMGRLHLEWMRAAGITPYAACDIDPERVSAAAEDFPGLKTFTDYRDMLQDPDLDFVVCILPHNMHAQVCLETVRAGKHCMSEKPFTLAVAEADEIIAAAHAASVTVTVFHNRRYDADIVAIREIVQSGEIGDVFHVEIGGGQYHHPSHWWRSDKSISGGALYDWGVHYIDWVLQIIPDPMENVTGFYHKRVWNDVTNEDHTQAVIRFQSGKYADVQISAIAAAARPHLRILGTGGAILYPRQFASNLTVTRIENGTMSEREVDFRSQDNPDAGQVFYNDLAAHLLRGEPLKVTAESARRNIAVIEAAERSSLSHQAEPVAHE